MERVNLAQERGVVRHRRWRDRWLYGPYVTVVSVGRLGDGRWFTERHGRLASTADRREGACVYEAGRRGQHLALGTAGRWMRTTGGEWIPIPAAYDSRQQPCDGLRWVRQGADWVLDE